ncbi:hypothetical protein A2971_00745 [Candidatus Gottesmanbacteria bacterium RIFCSPLOWO2_01_FULL_46_21]|uniref:Probable DNA ligase n=1 Tax=Candidatus Gottesmanbacteria bacterium RIFCSPLOWO2_01_FULL_46_21 TaxID=1798393 RepID=A0A1F6AYN5_9BACT|nr:MAG: hypothetical protein A2971_00745 [Candidatus Gottesmanbacteria bacterium RIFCSPLOWO2_01_FULL_46_21]
MKFSILSEYFKKLEDTSSRNAITEILADLFGRTSADEIGKICYLLGGRVGPLYEAIEFGVADKFIMRAIARAYDKRPEEVLLRFKKMGDLGTTAEALHTGKGTNVTVGQVYDKLYEIAVSGGIGSQEKKIALLSDLFSSVDALSARYLARIPLDKLRLGFSDMTILDALSWMHTSDKSLRPKLEERYNVRPDIGLLAQKVKEEGAAGLSAVKAKIGAPILAALCQRITTSDEMIKKMGKVAVEPKYDGVRIQIHVGRDFVRTFSRNLENTTDMFPELVNVRKELNAREVILDGEAVGYDARTGRLFSFQETTTRKRKHDIESMRAKVPLKFFIFDVLYKDGKDLLKVPLLLRRDMLEKTVKSGKLLALSPQVVTDDANTLRRYHDEQLGKGLEGAVVKKWHSIYEPGRRGYNWVKYKEEGQIGKLTDTIDAVIMGYYRGEGKRTGFGIGAFLVGVRKGESFVTVTKIGTGVSDELWKDLRTKLNAIKVSQQPKEYIDVSKLLIPDVWVVPKIVVELAGDDLTKSSNHGAGIAVRFPRLVRIRTDKSPPQATTVEEVEEMYKSQNPRIN